MRIGTFLMGMTIIALLSFASFSGLIFYFDPFKTSKTIVVLVYLTLFFGLTSFLTLGVFFARRVFSKNKNLVMADAINSFWQGSLLALLLISILVLIAEI